MKPKTITIGVSLLLLFLVMGVNALEAYVNVTVNVPADNTWDADRIVIFNCTAYGHNQNISNMSLYIDGVINNTQTKTGIGQNISTHYNWTITFSADSCTGRTWYCRAVGNESNLTTGTNVTSSTARTIKLDATAPTVTCDRGSTFYDRMTRGSLIHFTTVEACNVSVRAWGRGSAYSASTIFTDTDDISTAGWISGDYTVNQTVCDTAGYCTDNFCTVNVHADQPSLSGDVPIDSIVGVQDNQLTATTPTSGTNPAAIIVIGGGLIGLYLYSKGSRKKR